MFEKIRLWYALGLWSEAMVQNAVKKGVLTQSEMDNIIKEANNA